MKNKNAKNAFSHFSLGVVAYATTKKPNPMNKDLASLHHGRLH
jgi:hypothetical protein